MNVVMIAPKRRENIRPMSRPTPTLWSLAPRGANESAMDSETAISLACHLGRAFDAAESWDMLIAELSVRGFSLRFEGTRLALVNNDTGASLCTCASLGRSFASLTARLGKPRVQADTAQLVTLPAQAAE
ncbi:MAG: hypothetical protein AB3N11_10850 [Arenibacterium sp.]